jgi:hypothetical protein
MSLQQRELASFTEWDANDILRPMICPCARLLLAICLFASGSIGAQSVRGSADSARTVFDPIFVASPQFQRVRTLEILGLERVSLIGSASASFRPHDSSRALQWRWLRPRLESTWNSDIPYSMNDGAPWAGRGLTFLLGGGVAGSMGSARFIVSPEIWRTQNTTFAVLPGRDSLRSGFASPFFDGRMSLDLPVRFGYRPTTAVGLGESSVWWVTRRVQFGISSESQWWGPGVRNALVLSNHAGGFPHAFVSPAKPITTRFGHVQGKWIVGALGESRFFDTRTDNDLRSLSGAIITFTPATDSGLVVGLARVVYSRLNDVTSLPLRAFDVILRRGGHDDVPPASHAASEQITALFGRWVMPHTGAEVYGEWGRLLLPASIRAFLLAPQFTQGYTIGTQWLPVADARSRLRVQLELTNLEQSPTSRDGDTISFYASGVVQHGYTHRGQVLGAAIGPGSSSQWLAVDLLRDAWSAGVYAGRIRWNTDAYYLQPTSVTPSSYDVSLLAGFRSDLTFGRSAVAVEATWQDRLNFLFQNAQYGFSTSDVFDRQNWTVRVRYY